ncbi:hypothetical protein CHS0354_010638, partial [Potamilus streckersoni]
WCINGACVSSLRAPLAPECPYGDAVSGCHVNECSSCTGDQLVQCCDTCDVRKTTQTQTCARSSVSRDFVTITNATSTAASMFNIN